MWEPFLRLPPALSMITQRNTATFGKRKHATEPAVIRKQLIVVTDQVQH